MVSCGALQMWGFAEKQESVPRVQADLLGEGLFVPIEAMRAGGVRSEPLGLRWSRPAFSQQGRGCIEMQPKGFLWSDGWETGASATAVG